MLLLLLLLHDQSHISHDDRIVCNHIIMTGRDAGSAQPSAMEMDEGAGLLFVGNWAEQVLVFDINSKPPNQVVVDVVRIKPFTRQPTSEWHGGIVGSAFELGVGLRRKVVDIKKQLKAPNAVKA